MHNGKNFAVLVDGENSGPKEFAGILREVQKYGTTAVKRVYADWTNPARSAWKDVLHSNGARPIQQFNYGKDAADHALIMDAIEILTKAPEINAVCIASSDNGFQFLAQRIREMGKYVMGVGRRHPPAKELIAACHNYVYFDNLPTSDSSSGKAANDEHEVVSPDELLREAYLSLCEDDEPIYLGELGTALKNKDSAFDPRTYGFQTLKQMVKGHPELFKIEEETRDRCFVRLIRHTPKTSQEVKGCLKRWIGTYGFIEGEDGFDYFFYKSNVVPEQRELRFKKGQLFRFTVSKAPDPMAEEESHERNGRAAQVVAV